MPPSPPSSTVNQAILEASPALDALLSDLGRAAEYPPDIPFQAAQARGVSLNATIGQITDGGGGILALPAVSEQLGDLAEGCHHIRMRDHTIGLNI